MIIRKIHAQVSLELITYTFISLILFTTYFLFISKYIQQDAHTSLENSASNLAYTISRDINLVYLLGGGYHLNISLPEKIITADYDIIVKGNKLSLNIHYPPSSYIQTLIFNTTTLNLVPGKINEIYNKNGNVYVRVYS